MTTRNIINSLAATAVLTVLGTLISEESSAAIEPGGTNTIGTLHYLNENLALGNAYGGYSQPGHGTNYGDRLSTSNPPIDSSGGCNGNTTAYMEVYYGNIGATGSFSWIADLSSRPGTPNSSNQSYVVGSVTVYPRGSGGGDQSDGWITLHESGAPVAGATQILVDVNNNPSVAVTLDYTNGSIGGFTRGVVTQDVEYHRSGSGWDSPYVAFTEVVAQGIGTLTLGGDTLLLEIDASGNDYLNVSGAATLDGILDIDFINGYSADVATFDLLTAVSIDASGATFSGPSHPYLHWEFEVVDGGQGQILRASFVPEPASLALLGLFAIALSSRRRRG